MTPFLEFRVWLRRGPVVERVLAAIATSIVVALLAWALVPLDYNAADDDRASDTALRAGAATTSGGDTPATLEGSTAPDDQPAGSSDPQPGGASPSSGTTGEASQGSAETTDAATSADPCAGPLTASDQGVSAKEVLVAVAIISLGGDVGNKTFGIRDDLEAVADAAAAGTNADGGVACRKLVIKKFRVNPLDPNDTRAKCLDIAAAKPLAVIDFGGYIDPVARACFVEHKLPFQSALAISEVEGKSSYPYLYTPSASEERQMRNWAFGAAERGTFDAKNGFKKLGLFTYDCEGDSAGKELIRSLHAVGVSDSQLSVFRQSCVTGGGTPNELAQAMAQHRQDGVSHVLLSLAQINAKSYVRNAAQIGWRPVWVAGDYGAITNTTSQGDWNDSFDGTVAITSDRSGEYNSGIKHKLVAPCQDWYRRAKVPPPDKDGDAGFGFCTFFTLFKTAADAAGPNLTRLNLLPSLSRSGRLFESTSYSDIMWNRPGQFSGGDFVRPIQWRLDCHCWKVIGDFKPAR
jgi:hypothetical protein